MNPNLQRWIESSVNHHFRTTLNDDYIWFANEERRDKEPPNRYELTMLGPDIDLSTDGETNIKLTLNLLIITAKDIKEPFRHMNYVGKGQAAFTRCIPLHKYGNFSDVDDKTYITEISLTSHIQTTSFGVLEPTLRILRSSLEAKYEIHLCEG